MRNFGGAQTQTLQQSAQRLVHQIPAQGDVREISDAFPHGAIALSWLHSQGQLVWLDPFRYQLQPRPASTATVQTNPSQAMHQFLHGRQCRWQALLMAFGFRTEAQRLPRCGHCDNCVKAR